MTNEKTKPEHKVRIGNVSATVWKNKGEFKGKETEYFSVTLEKSYKDKKDEWKTTNSYAVNDLFKVKLAIDQALTKIYEKDVE